MPDIPSKPSYTHGSTGTKPSSPLDKVNGDALDANHLDYFIDQPFSKIKDIIDFLNALDSDEDGVVDAADTLGESAQLAPSDVMEVSDYDSDNNNIVDNADKVDGYDAQDMLQGELGLNLPSTDIPLGDFVALSRIPFPSSTTLHIRNVGAFDAGFNSPSGLDVVIRDVTNGQTLATYNGYNEPGDSLNVGGLNVVLAVDNGHFGSGTTSKQEHVTSFLSAGIE